MTFWEFASQQPFAACVLGFFTLLSVVAVSAGAATAVAAFATTTTKEKKR